MKHNYAFFKIVTSSCEQRSLFDYLLIFKVDYPFLMKRTIDFIKVTVYNVISGLRPLFYIIDIF